MSHAADRIDCRCMEVDGPDGPVLVPNKDCEIHWRQVIDADLPPAELFP